MTLDELNSSFGLPGILHFAADPAQGDLPAAHITLPGCNAQVFLHGAHLAAWQPTGEQPVLFLSDRSAFADGKAIRGGVPVCFPWFGPRTFTPSGEPLTASTDPSHGFARTQPWQLASAMLMPGGSASAEGEPADNTLHLTFTLGPTETSRQFGYGSFRVAYEMIFGANRGRSLTLRLSVANPGPERFVFEEALHSYFAVADVTQTTLDGVSSAAYLDKTDHLREKIAPETPLQFTAQTDSVFFNHAGQATINDRAGGRAIPVWKGNSATTVVWNPWSDVSATLKDLPPEAWRGFVCVETANTGADRISLQAGEVHTMEAEIRVEPMGTA